MSLNLIHNVNNVCISFPLFVCILTGSGLGPINKKKLLDKEVD